MPVLFHRQIEGYVLLATLAIYGFHDQKSGNENEFYKFQQLYNNNRYVIH